MKTHIFLIGFMGSGKTHWGRQLATRLQMPFIDLDAAVEQGEGQSVGILFAEKGELAFRELERDYLHQLADLPASVVSTGGGAPCFFDNLDWMKNTGRVIYLQTPVAELARRLSDARSTRPLLAHLDDAELVDFIEKLLAKRAVFYEAADATVAYEDVEAAQFLERLVKKTT